MYEHAENSLEFEIWFESMHSDKYSANHEGSSGGMEVEGMVNIFERSETLHKAKYAYYIGDGDAKTFANITEKKPYGDFIINKLECVLHVGKRMFRHLKEAKKSLLEMRKIRRADEKKKVEKEKQEKKEKVK